MGYFTYFTEESPSLVNRNNRCSRLRCVNIVPSLHKIYFWENFCKYCFYIDAGDAVQCKRRISEKSGKTFLSLSLVQVWRLFFAIKIRFKKCAVFNSVVYLLEVYRVQ